MRIKILLIVLLALFNAPLQADEFVFTPIDASQGLSDNQVRSILQLSDGRMVFTTSGNVNIYDGSRFKYIHRTTEDIYELNGYDGFYRMYKEVDSLLWIKDARRLMCINLYRERYVSDIEPYFRSMGADTSVHDFFIDSQNRIWLLTADGLLQSGSSLNLDLSKETGVLQDLDCIGDSLYLFYNTGKVICYDSATKERLYDLAAYPESELDVFRRTSLVVKGNDGFYQLRNGRKGGFFFFDPQARTWEKLLETDYTLNTLTISPTETAYISTKKGFWTIQPRTGERQYSPLLKTEKDKVLDAEISTIFYDVQGGLWLGTFNRGLLYYHPSRYKFEYIGPSAFHAVSAREIGVQAFAEDIAGNIYIKSRIGYYKYSPSEQDTHSITPATPFLIPEDASKLLNQWKNLQVLDDNKYTSLCKDSRGWTWAGTADGLMLFRLDLPERIIYSEEGLVNNFVHGILEDKNNDIWVTTSFGISHIHVDEFMGDLHFTNYNPYDGTLDGEYINSSVFESADGTLYFGGIDGFNVLKPQTLPLFAGLPFKPLFTSLALRGEEIKVGEEYNGGIILDKSPAYIRNIQLSYNQNFLTFEFSALNYRNPFQTYYLYRLEGLDNKWNETSAGGYGNDITNGKLKFSYTNLQPGRYTLQVMSSDTPNQWQGEISEVSIVIHAPWWKTPFAYISYALLFLLAITGSIYFYVYIIKKKLERSHKEELLLLRIRNLVEQLAQYEAGAQSAKEAEAGLLNRYEHTQDIYGEPNHGDSEFVRRAMEMVEKNLDIPGYSVEQLSRDLCMDRTGLYRKLTALLDASPSLFIRNIRLQRAAQLILENKLSITEIAETVGFSSKSYMSKCFQEMYGCRPSKYRNNKKST